MTSLLQPVIQPRSQALFPLPPTSLEEKQVRQRREPGNEVDSQRRERINELRHNNSLEWHLSRFFRTV